MIDLEYSSVIILYASVHSRYRHDAITGNRTFPDWIDRGKPRTRLLRTSASRNVSDSLRSPKLVLLRPAMAITHFEEPRPSQVKVAGAVTFYIVAALVMVLVNKAVLNKTPDLPFSFLFIQLVIAVLLLRFIALISRTGLFSGEVELPTLDRTTATKLLPFLVVGFIGLVFNTLCLANVDASFFQIARGLLLPFTILVASLCTKTMPKPVVLCAAGIVSLGFFIGVAPSFLPGSTSGAAREPIKALVYGVISCMVLSVHAVLSKVATSNVNSSALAISYWGNLLMSVMVAPLVVLNGELGKLHTRWISPEQDWLITFVVGSAVTGVFGFMLGIASVVSIKVTSPISHMFSAAAKSVIQIVLGVFFFGDVMNIYRFTAISLITGGTIFYTWIQSHPPPSPSRAVGDVEKQSEEMRPLVKHHEEDELEEVSTPTDMLAESENVKASDLKITLFSATMSYEKSTNTSRLGRAPGLDDFVLGFVGASTPPSQTLDHTLRFLSTWSGTDKLMMSTQYAARLIAPALVYRALLQFNAKKRTQPASLTSEGLLKFAGQISIARRIMGFWGLLGILKGLSSLERSPPASRLALNLARLQGLSMIVFYPLEYISFFSAPFAPVLRISPSLAGKAGLWSVRAWGVYVLLKIVEQLHQWRELSNQQEQISLGDDEKAQAARVVNKQKRYVLAHHLLANVSRLPVILHWSVVGGVYSNELLTSALSLISGLAAFRGGWEGSRIPAPMK
ncbi:unnamed protein product [Mycena citricolor]|uniref:Sugar phosphate transporter domain-containing protein n=1 Tax=Mycena citricolor TaxID=2018698 RepID=A0AAD2HEE1_9AGAR|nr:unnamed protein product [Mycena citricolor]